MFSSGKRPRDKQPAAAIHVDATDKGAHESGAGALGSSSAAAREAAGWRAAAARVLGPLLWDVVDPRGTFRKRWDMLMVLALAFLIVEVPLVVCFGVVYG